MPISEQIYRGINAQFIDTILNKPNQLKLIFLMDTRLDQLEEFAREEPNNPFNLYALALEYQKTDVVKATEIFYRLITAHQDYVPTYYQLGKLHEQDGRIDLAISIFEKGMVEAKKSGDSKAMRELDGARLALLYDN